MSGVVEALRSETASWRSRRRTLIATAVVILVVALDAAFNMVLLAFGIPISWTTIPLTLVMGGVIGSMLTMSPIRLSRRRHLWLRYAAVLSGHATQTALTLGRRERLAIAMLSMGVDADDGLERAQRLLVQATRVDPLLGRILLAEAQLIIAAHGRPRFPCQPRRRRPITRPCASGSSPS